MTELRRRAKYHSDTSLFLGKGPNASELSLIATRIDELGATIALAAEELVRVLTHIPLERPPREGDPE